MIKVVSQASFDSSRHRQSSYHTTVFRALLPPCTLDQRSVMMNAIIFTMLFTSASTAAVDSLSPKADTRNIIPGTTDESGSTQDQQYGSLVGQILMLIAILAPYGESGHVF